MLPPRGVSTTHWTQSNFGRAGDLPNIITDAKFEINWYKIVTLAKGWRQVSCFSTTTSAAINTAKPCRAVYDEQNIQMHQMISVYFINLNIKHL